MTNPSQARLSTLKDQTKALTRKAQLELEPEERPAAPAPRRPLQDASTQSENTSGRS